MTALPFAALAALALSFSATPGVAATVSHEATLAFLSESFDGAHVEDLSGTVIAHGVRLPGANDAFGFSGRYSHLAPGDTVTLSFGYDDAATTPPAMVRLTSCSLGAVSCLSTSFPFARLSGADGSFGFYKADGPDIIVEGSLVPGETVTFTELYTGTRAPALGGEYRGFFGDYLAEFAIVASTFAPAGTEDLAVVPVPASAALLPLPFLLLWSPGRRRRA